MKNNYIEFKKKRDLSDILSDSFAFLRSQFKPLLTTFFKILGPYLLVIILSLGFYFYALSFTSESLSGDEFTIILTIILVGILLIFGIAAGVMSQSSILYFIESYINNNGTTNFLEIKKKVYQNFWSFLGLGILIIFSVFIGFICCFLPGIYLYVPLSLAFAIYVFSKKDVIDSYKYSFTLVKDEWWMTFATLLIIGMVVGIAGVVFSLPVTIYSLIKAGISASEYDPVASEFDLFKDPIYIFLYLIAIICRLVINIVNIIAWVLIYFNLNEKKNFTGTYERIKNLGENS